MARKYDDIAIGVLQVFLIRFELRKKSILRKKGTPDSVEAELKDINDKIKAVRETIRLLKQDEYTKEDFNNALEQCCNTLPKKKRGKPSREEVLEKGGEHFDMNM